MFYQQLFKKKLRQKVNFSQLQST